MELFDWREPWVRDREGLVVELIIPGPGDDEVEDADTLIESIGRDIKQETQANDVHVSIVDPTIGAGTTGLGIALEFLSTGADVLTYVMAATAAAPGLRKGIKYLRAKLTDHPRVRDLYLSGEALQILTLAEVFSENTIRPEQVVSVRRIDHDSVPSEPRLELQRMYAAYTITVDAQLDDNFHHVWSYLVTPHGFVISSSHCRLPQPNASHWYQVDLPSKMLTGLT